MKPLTSVPPPTVMPIDRAEWKAHSQSVKFREHLLPVPRLQSCHTGKKLLIVGSGQGLDAVVFRWRGYDVTFLDIDQALEPDIVGSVHDMSMFVDQSFDARIASHVLEHFAEAHLDNALREIARVARYALIYLPVAGRTAPITNASVFDDLIVRPGSSGREEERLADPSVAVSVTSFL